MALSAEFVKTPKKNNKAKWIGGRLCAPFLLKAKFEGTKKEIQNGRYRQSVKGWYKCNGKKVAHHLCGTEWLNDAGFSEDGCPPKRRTAYGYRENKHCEESWGTDVYLDDDGKPDMAHGAAYVCSDEPGIGGAEPGSILEMHLEYHGALIDQKTGKILAEHSWNVKGEGKVPSPMASKEMTEMAQDRLLSVELLPDGTSGWQGTLFISGPDPDNGGQAPSIAFQIEDDGEKPLGFLESDKSKVVNVGSPRNRTWSIGFRLAPDQAEPDIMRGQLDGEDFLIKLEPRR